MITANIRKQGGAAIMTIPADILKMIDAGIGSTVEIQPAEDGFYVRAARKKARKRYTLEELLTGMTGENARELNAQTAWARAGDAEGRELA